MSKTRKSMHKNNKSYNNHKKEKIKKGYYKLLK